MNKAILSIVFLAGIIALSGCVGNAGGILKDVKDCGTVKIRADETRDLNGIGCFTEAAKTCGPAKVRVDYDVAGTKYVLNTELVKENACLIKRTIEESSTKELVGKEITCSYSDDEITNFPTEGKNGCYGSLMTYLEQKNAEEKELEKSFLVVGTPSEETSKILGENKGITVIYMKESQLDKNPAETISKYKIIMLDQSGQESKEISRQLGYAMQNYVKTGGKFIIVKDSGIRQPNASDVIGWKATFGGIVPVSCDWIIGSTGADSSCGLSEYARGRLWASDTNHPIMKGIDQFPAESEEALIAFETFDVTPQGKELAYIQDEFSKKYYPGIVESKANDVQLGKVIYFNYDPGLTPEILKATIEYLQGKR